jgi:hypothetical protein
MIYTTDILLRQAEQALEDQDLAALLPYAAELENHSASADVYAFFKKLTQAVICSPGEHIRLFSHCLEAVCAYDPVGGAAFLENMLLLAGGVEDASSSPAGILH